MAIEAAPNTPSADRRPRDVRFGRSAEPAAYRPTAAAPVAPTRRNILRETSWAVGGATAVVVTSAPAVSRSGASRCFTGLPFHSRPVLVERKDRGVHATPEAANGGVGHPKVGEDNPVAGTGSARGPTRIRAGAPARPRPALGRLQPRRGRTGRPRGRGQQLGEQARPQLIPLVGVPGYAGGVPSDPAGCGSAALQ